MSKAISYFKEAYLLDEPESSFYLAFLLQQTLLVTDFDQYFADVPDVPGMISHLYQVSVERGSYLAQKALISSYKQCIGSNAHRSPKFLVSNTSHPFHSSPL